MSRANYMYDIQWSLRLVDEIEKFHKGGQIYMAKSWVQKIRENLETYGRTGYEGQFENLRFLEYALERGLDPAEPIKAVRNDLTNRSKKY